MNPIDSAGENTMDVLKGKKTPVSLCACDKVNIAVHIAYLAHLPAASERKKHVC